MHKILKEKAQDLRSTLTVSKRLLVLLWGFDKKIFIAHLFAMTIPAIIPFANAYIYKLIIDLIVKSIGHPFDFNSLYFLLGIRFVTLLIQYAAASLQSFTELLIWSRLPIHIYQVVLGKLASLDVEYFEDSKFRDTLQKVRESYAYMPMNMFSNLFYAIQSIVQLSISFISLVTLNWALAVGIIIASLPALLNQLYYSKTLWGVWSENSPYRKKFWYLSELIQDKFGIKEMKIFATAGKFLSEINDIQKKLARENLVVGKKRLRNSFLLSSFGSVVYVAIEGFIAFITISGKITLGSLSYFTFAISSFEGGVSSFFSSLNRIFEQSLYVKEIFQVLDLNPKISISPSSIKIDVNVPPEIEFKNVTFSYPGSKEKILNNFELTIKPGEKVAFVGENGAGKTTIIKLLARFYDVTSGEILVNGHNIKDLDLTTWHKTLGVIFQDFIKYEYSLADNIHFGKIYEEFSLDKIKT